MGAAAAGRTRVTVLVDGIPEERTFGGGETVREFIGGLLPPGQKASADEYMLSLRDGQALDPASALGGGDIADGSVMALTKRDGGGGACGRTPSS